MNTAQDVCVRERNECDTKTVTTPTPERYTRNTHRLYIPWPLSQMSVLNPRLFSLLILFGWQKGFSICFVNALSLSVCYIHFNHVFSAFIVLFLCWQTFIIFECLVSLPAIASSPHSVFLSNSLSRFIPHTFFLRSFAGVICISLHDAKSGKLIFKNNNNTARFFRCLLLSLFMNEQSDSASGCH